MLFKNCKQIALIDIGEIEPSYLGVVAGILRKLNENMDKHPKLERILLCDAEIEDTKLNNYYFENNCFVRGWRFNRDINWVDDKPKQTKQRKGVPDDYKRIIYWNEKFE